ncbi:MAG TPA: hypothetical protein VI391_07095 [Thermoanaerobaculia bacterium]
MQELKAEKPIESPDGTDPVTRLIARLGDEGFTTDQNPDDWQNFGEIIYSRPEKISVASGETTFIFTRVPELNERILRQTADSVVNTYRARQPIQKALSVLQSTTVYHCLVVSGDQPQNEPLIDYVTRRGGATFIPIVFVPEINEVIYPDVEERVASIKPRIEYLQYLIGERRDNVDMHRMTRQAFWISLVVVGLILLAIAGSFIR